MLCMADWYLRGGDPNDQTRLSRILDVAQDLKALSMLLNISQFTFVVDLACLASRREYLKLDKWLTDKIREHGVRISEVSICFMVKHLTWLALTVLSNWFHSVPIYDIQRCKIVVVLKTKSWFQCLGHRLKIYAKLTMN